jgi:hypothetical protein
MLGRVQYVQFSNHFSKQSKQANRRTGPPIYFACSMIVPLLWRIQFLKNSQLLPPLNCPLLNFWRKVDKNSRKNSTNVRKIGYDCAVLVCG